MTVGIDLHHKTKMAYFGGFRNKKTGAVYLHASMQTDRRPTTYVPDAKLTRETQTFEMKTRSTQLVREASTQMARPDLLLDESNDLEVRIGTLISF